MIDIVIPLRYDKQSDDLRFALRSVEKHLHNYKDIWLIGDLPDWCIGVRHIASSDSSSDRMKEYNIYRKLLKACEHPEITDSFLMMNDDHYLLKDYDAQSFPYYTHRTLFEGQQANQGAYRTTLIRTEKLLKSMALGVLDFDCHCPIVYEREKFLEAFSGVEWKDYGYGIKSYYGNYWGVEGVKCEDLKLTGRKLSEMASRVKGRDWFSTGTSNPMMQQFLAGIFPHKSRFER